MKTKRQTVERATKIAYWQPHIEAWQSSGQRTTSYCREHKLNFQQFKYWQYQLAPESKKSSKLAALLPNLIELDLPETQPQETHLEFQSSNGLSLHMRGQLSPSQLQQLFTLLSDLPC